MKKILSLAIGSALLPGVALADALGFEVGASQWQQQWDGTVQSGPDSIDLESDLGLDDETNNVFYALIEHPIPLLPNVLVQRTELEISANNTLSEDIEFEDITFPDGTNVASTVDLSHTDLTLYYELLDNWVSLDLGLTARLFDEGVSISSSALAPPNSAKLDIDGALPMAYVAARIELPLNLYVGANANWVSYSGDTVADMAVNVGFEFDFGLGLEVGYRSFDIDYEDDDDESADLTVDGGYAALFFNF